MEKFTEIMNRHIVEEIKPNLPKIDGSKLKLPKLKRLEA